MPASLPVEVEEPCPAMAMCLVPVIVQFQGGQAAPFSAGTPKKLRLRLVLYPSAGGPSPPLDVQLVRYKGGRQRVPGAVGAAGRQRLGGAGDEREPATADGEREPAEPDLREQGPDAGGHGGALRRAHHRQRALQLVRQPALRVRAQRRAGPQHGPVLPGRAHAAVPQPERRRARRDGGHGPRHPHRLRHQLLRLHRRQARPARLRPGAPRRPDHRRPGRRLHQQPRHVPGRLRRRHGQDGRHRSAHRHRRHHPDQLQGRQLIPSVSIHRWARCLEPSFLDWGVDRVIKLYVMRGLVECCSASDKDDSIVTGCSCVRLSRVLVYIFFWSSSSSSILFFYGSDDERYIALFILLLA
nr:uncharacterized protein LOC117839839 isoform X2 [Setaria viridis]